MEDDCYRRPARQTRDHGIAEVDETWPPSARINLPATGRRDNDPVPTPRPGDTPDTDLTTDRLVLRTWTTAAATAVVDGTRLADWAEDFPDEGDQVIAGLFDKNGSVRMVTS